MMQGTETYRLCIECLPMEMFSHILSNPFCAELVKKKNSKASAFLGYVLILLMVKIPVLHENKDLMSNFVRLNNRLYT